MAPPKVGKQHFCKHYHSANHDSVGRSHHEVGLAFWRTWVDLRGIGEACTNRLHHLPSTDAKVPQHCRQSKTQRHRQPTRQPKQMPSHKNARSAYPWLMMQPKGTHTSAKSQVSITHRYPLASRLEIGYALRAFLREMWYLHVHFTCARLHAFYAVPLMPSRLDILATRVIVNIERKSSFAKRIVSRPHSGRFSRHSCTRQTEVLNAKRPLRVLNRKPNRMGLEAKPRAPYLCYITARYNTLAA